MHQCGFCTNNAREIDYKETDVLRKFLNFQGKIMPRGKTGVCAKHQRKLALAIKNARFLALLPFVNR